MTIRQAYWTSEKELAWEDEDGLHSGAYATLSERYRAALDEWIGQGNTIAPYVPPVEGTPLEVDLQTTFFQVMAENVRSGKMNVTLREMVEEADRRIKNKKQVGKDLTHG
jgi:hypothetical protein